MNKQKTKRLLIALFASMIATLSFAVQFDDSNGLHYETTSDSTVEVVQVYVYDDYGYHVDNSFSGDIKIPESVVYNEKEYQVTSIGKEAFSTCSRLISIEIPKKVSVIKRYAFSRCSGLKTIKLPDTVVTIEDYAFDQCSGLSSIDIPNSVTNMGEGLFCDCTGLQTVNLPSTMTVLPAGFFINCTSLVSFEIPSKITQIGNCAFEECSSLSSVTIPNTVTVIGGAAFRGCTSLKSINIPNSVKSMDDLVFQDCTGLTSLELPELNGMGYALFSGCTNLTIIYVPTDGIKYMVESRCGYHGEVIVRNPTLSEDLTYRLQRENQILASVTIGNIFYDGQEDVGFEYREQGANEEKPIRVSGVVFDHKLEGVISNLEKGKTYEVRPYGYDWRNDIEVQGQWTTVTIGEPSFYDPIVHTYSDGASVDFNYVILHGVVLCGTDDIIEQGFEYWTINDDNTKPRHDASSTDVQKVRGREQFMYVRMDNLSPGTTYGYRAFASTATATVYGDEYTFMTMNTANGIDEVDVRVSPENKRLYYNINGQQLTTLRRGINITRMNDGTVKKVLVK